MPNRSPRKWGYCHSGSMVDRTRTDFFRMVATSGGAGAGVVVDDFERIFCQNGLYRRGYVGFLVRLIKRPYAVLDRRSWVSPPVGTNSSRGSRGCPNAAQMQTELTAKDFLLGWHTPLCWCCQVVLALCLVAIIPALFFGLASRWAGGFGALFVSLLLPVVLVANGSLLLLAVGVPAWPLMPMTLAAECSDAFDALSRSYNYLYDQPIRFTLLTAIAVGIAALPLLAVLYPFAEHLAEWEPAARTTVVLFAAALSASIYWSLQALVYLHLRAVADNIDASVIAVERSPELKKQQAAARAMVARRSGQVVDNAAELEKAEDAPLEEKPKTPAFTEAAREAQKASPEATPDEEISGGPLLRKSLILEFAALIGSWFLTVWLLSRFSGEAMAWLRWGLDDRLVPPAEGIYKVSSLIAGLWGLLWLSLPLWVRSLKSWFARLRAKKTLAARQDRQVST